VKGTPHATKLEVSTEGDAGWGEEMGWEGDTGTDVALPDASGATGTAVRPVARGFVVAGAWVRAAGA
jgi:hypothetical protein